MKKNIKTPGGGGVGKKPRNRMVNVGRRTLMYDNRSPLHNNLITKSTPRPPFRISDESLLIGKYKGYKLDVVDIDYLIWLKDNVEMSSAHKSIIKNKIDGEHKETK
tara:strand:- start:1646 stop:1963 length:318 start_codon:yes stop_codon:yes gene_type:complete